MEIQWPLVAFTCLTGAGGWLLVCAAIDHFKQLTSKTNSVANIVGFVIVVVGGLASVLHLSHPENILGALNRPTSGIFTEAVLTGLTALMCFIYFIVERKSTSKGALKVLAVLAAVFGAVLSFSSGASYMMGSQPTWNTPLLPLGFLGVAIPLGVSIYLGIAKLKGEKNLKPYCQLLFAAGIIAVILVALYAAVSGALHDAGLWCGIAALVLSGVAPAIIGFFLQKEPDQADGQVSKGDKSKALVCISVISTLLGSVFFHVLQYTGADFINNFYQMM